MQCTHPRAAGFNADGSITFSRREYSKSHGEAFQVPCNQCLECLLRNAQERAVRCVHEAQMHDASTFITLTYREDKLESPWLDYSHWQGFMKNLRHKTGPGCPVVVVGEYGEKLKRPHWHALIFGYQFPDLKYSRTNDNGDKIFTSELLDREWGFNDPDKKPCEVGNVSLKSAGYVARYQVKKLAHGHNGKHPYNPKYVPSKRYAIGKSWLEKYWFSDCFANGRVVLDDGSVIPPPRYYEKWFYNQGHDEDGRIINPYFHEEWLRYVTEVKVRAQRQAVARKTKEDRELAEAVQARSERLQVDGVLRPWPQTRAVAREAITKARISRFKQGLE